MSDPMPTRTAITPNIASTFLENLVAELEKNPKVLSFEAVIVNLVAACAFVVGLFRPDLKTQISAVPQAAITAVAIAAFVVFNAWNLYIKKTHVGIKISALLRLAELDLTKALPAIEQAAKSTVGIDPALIAAPLPASVAPAAAPAPPAGAADPTT